MKKALVMALMCVFMRASYGLDPGPNDLYMRVVDVGSGLCCVIRIPPPVEEEHSGDYNYIVYDAGNYKDHGGSAMEAIRELIPHDEGIDLLVLSHTDADHQAAVDDIIDEYYVDRILRTGAYHEGNLTKTLKKSRAAVKLAVEEDDAIDINLSKMEFPHGGTWRIGDAFVTFVYGYGTYPEPIKDELKNQSERNNARSIVIRVFFEGKSLLLCGDAVGRHIGDADDAKELASERVMVEQQGVITIDSDVLVAGHHGADNATSAAFVAAVSPSHVIFSAGHAHDHPTKGAVGRLKAFVNSDGTQLTDEDLFRTDRCDDESDGSGDHEWDFMRKSGYSDPIGDDDVDVVIRSSGALEVAYRTGGHECTE